MQIRGSTLSPDRAERVVCGAMGGEVTMPESSGRAEHVSLLGWQLEPESARTARVTKQSAVPVTTFLTCAALFFTSCVGVLVVGARPSAGGVASRVVPLSSLQAQRDVSVVLTANAGVSAGLNNQWYTQGSSLDAITIDHQGEGLLTTPSGDFVPQPQFESWKGAPYWQHFREMPVVFSEQEEAMQTKPLVVVAHATDAEHDSAAPFLQSVNQHALPAAISGEGTHWHGTEDKVVGLKAALLSLKGDGGDVERQSTVDPVIVWSDVGSVQFSCGAKEMVEAFEKTNADVVLGSSTGSDSGHPHVVIGRASKLMDMVTKYESYLGENTSGKSSGKTRKGAGGEWSSFANGCVSGSDKFELHQCLDRYVTQATKQGTQVVQGSLACIETH